MATNELAQMEALAAEGQRITAQAKRLERAKELLAWAREMRRATPPEHRTGPDSTDMGLNEVMRGLEAIEQAGGPNERDYMEMALDIRLADLAGVSIWRV